MEFGNNLKKYRKINKISQVELANSVGVKQGTIANYETGNRSPTIELLLKLAIKLNVSTDDLLGVENNKEAEYTNNKYAELNKQLVENLLNNEEYEVFKALEKIFAEQRDLTIIFEDIMTPVMVEIGSLWEMGKISIAHEHTAVAIMIRMVDWLSISALKGQSTVKKAVCMSISPDLHTLGIRMISIVLELEGYQSIYIGNNLPTRDLIRTLEAEKPEVFMISVTISSHMDATINLINLIRETPSLKTLKIVVGGQSAENSDLKFIENVTILKSIKSLKEWLYEINKNNKL